MPTASLQKSIYDNIFTRTFGGTVEPAVADLFISGFGYFWFDKLPAKLTEYTGMGDDEMKKVLAALCQRVTPPTRTLNKTTQTGLGGKKWSTPTNVDVGDAITLSFFEMSGMPITRIVSAWVDMIRDARHGTSILEGDEYAKTKYSATGLYIVTKPDGKTIEYALYITGMFPQKDPTDNLALDVATNDKVDMDIDFNADNVWRYRFDSSEQSFIKSKCETLINTIMQVKQSYMQWSGPSSK